MAAYTTAAPPSSSTPSGRVISLVSVSVATPTQPCNMAATGKKGKKAKWVKANLTDILAEPTTIPATNWAADTVEETEGGYNSYGGSRTRAPVVLPSVSRAARGGMAVDDESIPRRPPYIAHISNLPYDVDESAIAEVFEGLKITNLRLPREGDRLKGFGYIDFEDRESLISAMNIADLTVSGRRIRIEVSTHDNDRRMGGSRGMGRSDRDREYDPERTSGDWRSGPRVAPDTGAGGGGGGGGGRPRMERERDPDRGEMTRAGMRERDPDSAAADNKPGGWRDGERAAPPPEPARTPYGGRDSFGRERFGEDRDRGGRDRGYGGRDGFRTAERPERDGGGFGSRESRGFGGRGFGDRDRDRERDPPREDSRPRERPKLNLLPRTVPRETEVPTKPADGAGVDPEKSVDKPKPVSAEKVFGAAKPVDTAAKEREIEERLRKQEEEARRATEEKEKWGSRREHSGDRRSGSRRDEPARDSRYNKDRRDYSKDDKDRRNDRERRDYSRDDRERRDYRPHDRDYRDRRDYSGERRRSSRDGSRDPGRSRDRRDDSRDRREVSRGRDGSRDRRDGSRDRRDGSRNRRDGSRDRRDGSRDHRDVSRDRRDSSRDRNGSRDRRVTSRGGSRRREDSRERREYSRGRADSRERHDSHDNKQAERNGDPRQSRSRDRHDEDKPEDKPLPKLKEQEKPNFVASNKFSFLEDADDVASD